MKKYLRLYLHIFKLSLMSEMAYRENFWSWTVIHTVSLLTMIIFFSSVYQGTSAINGWNQYQVLLVLGIGTLITSLGSLTFFSFMYQFADQIANGGFDARLSKPADVLFQSAFCWIDFEDVIVIPNSLLLVGYSLWQLHPPHLFLNFTLGLLLLISSLVILFSFLTLIQSLAFKYIRVESATNFYWSLVNVTKYPAKAIKNISRLTLMLFTPIAIISSVPSEVLFGRFDFPWIFASVVLAASSFILGRKVFYSALRHYSSASS